MANPTKNQLLSILVDSGISKEDAKLYYGLLKMENPFERIGEFLQFSSKEDRDSYIVQHSGTSFSSSFYDTFKKEVVPKERPVLEDSEFQCRNRKCRSKKTECSLEQRRSADEPMTCTVVCNICKSVYSF